MIGDKVPVITNSVTPIQTGSAVVTGTVQYLDVGIKLEVEPHVYAEGDVGIKMNLEVSNIVKEVRNLQSGTLAYQIGTRNAQSHLRLRDGETQILGGLISDQDRNTASKVPGLGQLPVLGRLFSSHANTGTKSEIILSITPRIIRGAMVADAGLRDVYSGTDASMRQVPLRLDPIGSVGAAMSTGGAGAIPSRGARPAPGRAAEAARPPVATEPASDPAAPRAASTAPEPASGDDAAPAGATPPSSDEPASPAIEADKPKTPEPASRSGAPAEPATRLSSGSAPAGASTAAAASITAPPGRGVPAEFVLTGPSSVRVGDEFAIVLEAKFHETLAALPLIVRFDPQVVSFVGAQSETLARAVGIESAQHEVDATTGRLDVDLQAAPNAPLTGQGKLLTLRFAAKNARAQTRIALGQVTVAGADGPRTISRPPTLLLRVNP
jgi:general secretion pathway protein D